MKNNIIHQLHQKSEELREQDHLNLALILAYFVFFYYQITLNYSGLSDIYRGLVLIYKHKYLFSKNSKYINIATKFAQKSLNVSINKKIKNIYISYFCLGEIFILGNNFSKAILNYKKALELYPRNDSEKGDYQYHLGEAQYRNGNKKSGLKNLLGGLTLINKYQRGIDSFLIHVWQSGCFLRLAELLKKDNPKLSKKYLLQADKIISSDSCLIIRKRQIKELKVKLNYG